MGRGTELAEGISLSSVGPTGVTETFHFQGDVVVVQRTQDLQDALDYVDRRRQELEGLPWGTGREVGYIPEIFYTRINAIRDRDERKRALKQFFVDNPRWCYFPRYLKGASSAPKLFGGSIIAES